MKKYLSLILLIVILFISNGSYLYFKYLQNNIRHEIEHQIEEGLSENELSLIILSEKNKHDIIWHKQGKEFELNGYLYDIVKTKIIKGKKYLYCINDIKEDKLIILYRQSRDRRNKAEQILRKIFDSKYFPEKFSILKNDNFLSVYFKEYKRFYKSNIIEVNTPPPIFNF